MKLRLSFLDSLLQRFGRKPVARPTISPPAPAPQPPAAVSQPDTVVQTDASPQAVLEPAPLLDAEALARRINRTVQSLLENEALTADLNDDAARPLLDWAARAARNAIQATAGLSDADAEALASPQLRALRQFMRQAGKWAAAQASMSGEDRSTGLDHLVEQAAALYGPRFISPDPAKRQAFLEHAQEFANQPAHLIIELQNWLEPAGTPQERV